MGPDTKVCILSARRVKGRKTGQLDCQTVYGQSLLLRSYEPDSIRTFVSKPLRGGNFGLVLRAFSQHITP